MRASTILIASLLVACGGGSAPAAASFASADGTGSAAPSPSPTAPPNAFVVKVTNEGSTATVRVREQLAVNQGQTDAVLKGIHILNGSMALLPDGSFWPGASVKIELTRLQSDVPLRDKWLELFGPQFGRFPTGRFTPSKAVGLPVPLPANGDWTFAVMGDLTIRDVTKPVRLDATLHRAATDLRATATTSFTWADFAIPKPLNIPQVASVEDDIRIEIAFAATAGP
jgi:polyisoprenoid-binding protein YceI